MRPKDVYMCAHSISKHSMHNASTEFVDLQYSIRCQLTKPADKLQYYIMRKDDTVAGRHVVDEIYSFIATGLFQFRVAVVYKRLKAYLIGFQSIRDIEITKWFLISCSPGMLDLTMNVNVLYRKTLRRVLVVLSITWESNSGQRGKTCTHASTAVTESSLSFASCLLINYL